MTEGISYDEVTHEQILADQQDLVALCADRQLDTTEIFTPNAYYGHDQIIKWWARWPARRPLKVAIPHGVAGLDELPSFGRRELVPVTAWSAPHRRDFDRRSGVTALQWPMALPYEYVAAALERTTSTPRRGTIFFPAHSTSTVSVLEDFDALAELVAAFPAARQPVTVCVYWKDVLLGNHQPFVERGLRVVSAGHGLDPLFLARFHHLCAEHEWAASNDVGSHLFYAMRSGCRYFHVETEDPAWEVEVRKPTDATYACVKAMVVGLGARPVVEQRRVADHFLGAAFAASRAGLRRMLVRAEIADVVAVTARRLDGRLVVVPPAAARRAVRRAARVLRRG